MATPVADHAASKSAKPSSSPFSSIRSKVGKLSSDLSRLGVAVKTTLNPNHRHDEEWEQEIDAKLEAIRASHRYRSFAGEREGNMVKFHVDGHDYFWALSEVIDKAEDSIMILDWWLSPELQLRRPAALFPEWRLDRLLKRKAEQGVRIYVMVYKEVEASMALSSVHTKHTLEDLHDNIAVMRHPDHDGGELVYYFSHHEKLCIVDNKVAAMGGLDACYGRWDTHDHPLADVHPTEFHKSLFPGQDYNNSRIMDFQTVAKYTSNALAIQDAPRMPWHDSSLTFMGPSVVDLVQHFCERWNFVKKIKYKHDHRMEWLALPSPWGDVRAAVQAEEQLKENRFRAEHPHLAEWKELGRQLTHPYHWPPSEQPRASEPVPAGTCRVQVVRSAADWSHGVLLEDSIQQAYIGMIREANHCVYIENQFLYVKATITTTATGQPVENLIGLAIAQRVISAAQEGRKFKVIVMIPAVPAFPGDIQGQSGIKAIMEAQYQSINRGSGSIYAMVREAGFEPNDYISFWNLRSYDRINTPWQKIREMEQRSGVSFHEAQVALARIYVGADDISGGDINEVVNIEKPHDSLTGADQVGKKDTVAKAVPLPTTLEEARDIVRRFELGATEDDRSVADNICQHAMQSGRTLEDEHWHGTDEEELSCIVTELLYIHSKIMIVDDRRVVVGSANLNDRSQNGDHDSEIAVVIEDMDLVESQMDGKKYMASRLATQWRRTLMREHLGLLPPQPAFDRETQPTDSMHPVPHPASYDWDSQDDLAVQDFLSDDFERLWRDTGRTNTRVFEHLFRPIPNDSVRSWKAYKEHLAPAAGIATGHIVNKELGLQDLKKELSLIRGHLVEMPLEFLAEEKWITGGEWLAVNRMTLALYV